MFEQKEQTIFLSGGWLLWLLGAVTNASSHPEVLPISLRAWLDEIGSLPTKVSQIHQSNSFQNSEQSKFNKLVTCISYQVE